MMTYFGARHSSLFFEAADAAFFEAAGAALRMSFFEAADADAIAYSDADWHTPDASLSGSQ